MTDKLASKSLAFTPKMQKLVFKNKTICMQTRILPKDYKCLMNQTSTLKPKRFEKEEKSNLKKDK